MVRLLRKFRPGSAVLIKIETRDETQVSRPLYSPARNPRLMIRGPRGVVLLDYGEMTREETGVFSYVHQTATSDPRGIYQAIFFISNETEPIRTVPVDVFELSERGGKIGFVARRFRLGSTVYIRMECRDETDELRPLVDPANEPLITIRTPRGEPKVADGTMVRLSTGVYTYTFVADPEDPIGVWQFSYKVVDTTYTSWSIPVDGWEYVPGDISHTDTAHSDVAHGDAHSDGAHSDVAHSDAAHTDVAHTDSHTDSHSDAAHTDTAHTDTHSDVAHVDSHTDGAHTDSHSDETGKSHTDAHSDIAHVDTHSDTAHTDTHSDVAHSDVAHSDVAHGDTHSDVAHADGHSDSAHTDVAHADTHSDSGHSDTAHADEVIHY